MGIRSTVFAATLAACSSSATINSGGGSLTGATIDVTAEGGYAALRTRHVVTHDDRAFVYSNRRICDKNCGAPMDSASVTLSDAAADSLFAAILAQDPFSLNDDYGPTKGGADMFAYTVRIAADGKSKIVRFDDGTMPERMRRILEAVRGTVSAARR
jgi:hypothetical protein